MIVDVSQGVEEYSPSTPSCAYDVVSQSLMQLGSLYSVLQQSWITSERRKTLL